MSWQIYFGNLFGTVAGALTVTESGKDSAYASGSVIVAGIVSASESAPDTLAAVCKVAAVPAFSALAAYSVPVISAGYSQPAVTANYTSIQG